MHLSFFDLVRDVCRRRVVLLNSVLLALQLGEYPRSAEAKAVVQRWLGAAVRNRFGHLMGKDDPVEEWARFCLSEAVLGSR